MTKSNQLSSSVVLSRSIALRLNESGVKMGKIHSVFPNGFNLVLNKKLVFVGKHGSNLSAFGLTIEARPFERIRQQLEVGQMVRLHTDYWTFYTRPHVLTLQLKDKSSLDLTVPNVTLQHLIDSQLVSVIKAAGAFALSGFNQSEQLQNQYHAWLEENANSDRSVVIRQLIGAGVGLTPTGDDFLQGMMLIEMALGQSDQLRTAVQKELNLRKTTDVSEAYYQALFEGQVNQSWVDLLIEIQKGKAAELEPIVKQIQAYGATSGNDILVGVLTYIQEIQN